MSYYNELVKKYGENVSCREFKRNNHTRTGDLLKPLLVTTRLGEPVGCTYEFLPLTMGQKYGEDDIDIRYFSMIVYYIPYECKKYD